MPPRIDAQRVVTTFAAECARITRSGAQTDERSFYTALNNLFAGIGSLTTPTNTTIPEPAARERDFPDIGIFEVETQVLVLPVEVKPANVDLDDLLRTPQPARYARTFGGGYVLVTNLREVVWAESDPATGQLRVRDRVRLVVGEPDEFTRRTPRVEPDAGRRLVELLEAACSLRSVLTKGDRVAALLAYHASRMLEAVEAAGDPHDLLGPLAESMRIGLGMELESQFFAPTIVQTLVYATFAGWLDATDPIEWDWRETGLMRVHVIGELFHEINSPAFVRRCDLVRHLNHVARVLRWVDREQFEAQFDDAAIEYFYEPFLAKFDPVLRDNLGVWYTPKEVAAYQARRSDYHLRTDLNLPNGLADENAIVLDPACGTGTYLRAVLDAIYERHRDNGEPPPLAAALTRQAALTRIIGFEVLPAALVVAHLHLHRHLARLGAPVGEHQRLRIYLTNSLVGWGAGDVPQLPMAGVEEEIRESLAVKRGTPVLVMLGNPPYHGYSAADSDEERELLADWITPLWPEYGLRKHRMGDLYVRFWRVTVRKIAELGTRGVVSYITNRKWLGGRSFPVMRDRITHEFQRVVVDDLHGDVHDTAHPDDGSIFTTEVAAGIQRGVAITTLVRTGPTDGTPAIVSGRDLRGSGAAKRAELDTFFGEEINAGLEERPISRASRWKLIGSAAGDDSTLDEYFLFYLSGVQPVGEGVFDRDRDALANRMRNYFDPTVTWEQLLERHPAFGVERARYRPEQTRRRLLETTVFDESRLVPFLFHPFDVRWLYWETEHRLLTEARRDLFPYYVDGERRRHIPEQFAIVAAQTVRRPDAARPALASAVPGFDAVDPNARVLPRLAPIGAAPLRGAGVPMQLGHEADHVQRTNIRPEWLAAARRIGVEGDDLMVGDTIFYALMAVMYAPSWAAALGTDNDDFAAVPLPATAAALQAAADLGRRIAASQDILVPMPGVTSGRLDQRYSPLAEPDSTDPVQLTAGNRDSGGRWVPGETDRGSVLWDAERGWRNVPRSAWEFTVGGFPVLSKWLGYRHARRGETLSGNDIVAFTSLVRRIAAILDLTDECEGIYQEALNNTLEPPPIA